MKKDKIIFDYKSYLRIIGTLMMISPLILAYWSLDFDLFTAGLITSIMYVVLIGLTILIFNYLEYGFFWFCGKDRTIKKL